MDPHIWGLQRGTLGTPVRDGETKAAGGDVSSPEPPANEQVPGSLACDLHCSLGEEVGHSRELMRNQNPGPTPDLLHRKPYDREPAGSDQPWGTAWRPCPWRLQSITVSRHCTLT